MQIFYALCILAFALHSLNEIYNSSQIRTQARSIASIAESNVDIQSQLSILTKKAYDQGRFDHGNSCPPDTRVIPGVGNTSTKRLCWSNNLLVGNCFRNIQFKGRRICFASDQTTISSNSTPPFNEDLSSPLELLVAPQTAYALPPMLPGDLRAPADEGDFSSGFVVTNPVPNASGGPAGQAYVRLPQAEPGLTVRGNHVDCTKTHTQCFSVIYCLNGQTSCSGKFRYATTYAVRFF